MAININFNFYSGYYRDIHFFTSEVIQFVKDFYSLKDEHTNYYDENNVKQMGDNDLNLVQNAPPFVEIIPFKFRLNDYENHEVLIKEIVKVIASTSENLNEENQNIGIKLTYEFSKRESVKEPESTNEFTDQEDSYYKINTEVLELKTHSDLSSLSSDIMLKLLELEIDKLPKNQIIELKLLISGFETAL
jgi:hypothetical protein